MNKWLLICFLGLVSVALANSSLRSDKETLIKALKEKFKQFKLKSASIKPQIITKESSVNDEKTTLPSHKQDQHDKASSALGLALLDIPKIKPKPTKSEHTTNHEKTKAVLVEKTDNGDDDDDDDEDDDDDNMMVTKINKHLEATEKKTKDSKDKHLNLDSKKSHKKKEKSDDDDDGDDDSTHDDEDTETNNNDESSSKDSSDVSDDDEDEGKIKNSDKKLKKSVKSLKNSVKSLKDKDLKSVNVGDLKKLLATSVENLDKAEKAIHNLLQYDQDKKNANKNQQTTAGPQSQYGGYPQVPSSTYQQTCPGQCSSLCAPGCRDPCCRFPPNMQGYNSPPVTAKGSYQQGLINSYPPLTSLGAAQSGENYQQGLSQQCGSQCSPQSCSPSCNPSCCSSGVQGLSTMPQGAVVPLGQVNAGCPSSCFSTCNAGCPRRCCVPGRK